MKIANRFYAKLYSKPPDGPEEKTLRAVLDKKVSHEDNIMLAALPDQEEVEGIIGMMATEKAQGEDGLTIEILKGTWRWTEPACIIGKILAERLKKVIAKIVDEDQPVLSRGGTSWITL
ncbi:hypothetical protein R1sor_009109 [Riccia sorocarpa]|uniref:Uncharacterized protein n=1 Tax=Riccia sorocarpa TaxID=122646 RepID=A0ABD3H4V8_9MARC